MLRCFLFVGALLGASAAAAEKAPVALRVGWDYEGVPAGMSLYELKPGNWDVWTTSVAPSAAQAPVARQIPGATVFLKPGESRRVALVYANATNKPVSFFAAPHTVSPVQAALGFKFRCLCVNRAYTVPPGGVWYRVVELRLARDFIGEKLEVVHQLLAVDEKSAADFRDGMSRKEVP